ncbi:MAG: hypothetical protein K9W44_14155 [Candidatus Lokiarchaeota archaeon]|nr:hypothetical protein [Candidatus Harpocratesius repetitus]
MKPLDITILTTTEDIASINIQRHLLSEFPFKQQLNLEPWDSDLVNRQFFYMPEYIKSDLKSKTALVRFNLIEIEHEFITLDEVAKPNQIHGDILIYASRHRSASERKALLCHTTGNINDDNSFGGRARHVSKGSGILMHYLYKNLLHFVETTPNYAVPVDHEVDHHGPTEFLQPSGFIELGSTETGWKDAEGAKIVAESIIQTGCQIAQNHYIPAQISDLSHSSLLNKQNIKVMIGFGGSHYMPSFQPIIPKGYGFAHTVPKYKIMAVDKQMLQQLMKQTLEPIDGWVVDWKGLNSAEKQHLIPLLEQTDIPIIKVKTLRKQT